MSGARGARRRLRLHHRGRRLRRLRAGQPPDAKTRRCGCCCWKPARPTASADPVPVGYGRPINHPVFDWRLRTCRSRRQRTRHRAARAAAGWAAPARSTAWCTSAASRATTTTGPGRAIRAGPSPRCCRTSCARRTTSGGATDWHGAGGRTAASDLTQRPSAAADAACSAARPRAAAATGLQRRRPTRASAPTRSPPRRLAGIAATAPSCGPRAAGRTSPCAPGCCWAACCWRATGDRRRVARRRERRRVLAAREVILVAGAYSSPQLLQLSGIGPARCCRQHGIAVRADAPGVGANLQDHY